MSSLCVSCERASQVGWQESQDKHRFGAHHECMNDSLPSPGRRQQPDCRSDPALPAEPRARADQAEPAAHAAEAAARATACGPSGR